MDVSDRGFLEEIAEAFLAILEHLLEAESLQLGRSTGSEYLKRVHETWLRRHGDCVVYREMPKNRAFQVSQWYAQVTLHLFQSSICWEFQPNVRWVMAKVPLQHFFARCAC